MLKKIIFIIFSILTVSCAAPKHITVEKETIEKTVVKDSIIYRDSIVYLPKERIVEVVPQLDTLKMDIELASAKAYLDTSALVLKGELKSKESPKKQYIERIEYRDRTDTVYVSKPVPYEVEKPVKYVPSFYKFCLWWFICSVILIALWIVMKLKP